MKLSPLLILLLILPLATAVEFDVEETYKQGETMIVKASGNFIDPILKENVIFKRGHVKIPLIYDVLRIDEEFYIYAVLPEEQNNYSVSIEDVPYKRGSEVLDDTITREFKTSANSTADFNVKPGVVIANDAFSLEVQNLKDSKIAITTTTNVEEKIITLKSGDIEKIDFLIEDFTEPTLEKIVLESAGMKYEVPLSVFLNFTTEPVNKEFRFDPSSVDLEMATNDNSTRVLYLYNIGNKDIENITLSVSGDVAPYVSFQETIEELEEDSSVRVDLVFTSDEDERTLTGEIRADADGFYAYAPLSVKFIPGFIPAGEEGPETLDDTCENLGGKICATGVECQDNDIVYATDGICCMSSCKQTKEVKFNWKIIGWVLVIVAVVFVIWFYFAKYRKTQASVVKTPLDKAKSPMPPKRDIPGQIKKK